MRSFLRAMAWLWLFAIFCPAQPLPKFMGRQLAIIEPEHTDDGFPKGPAVVCLEGPPKKQCYTAPMDLGNRPTLEIVQLRNDSPALLFSAETGGVSGWSVRFALLGPDLDNLLFADSVSNQNQHTFWFEPAVSDWKIFLTASFVWGPDEGHYGPHRYIISAYFPSASADDRSYRLQDRFMTIRRYDLDDKAEILGSERSEILHRLKSVVSAH
jgi:hypothetical protein